jgi:phage terminase small subunit
MAKKIPKTERKKTVLRSEIFAREYIVDLNGTRAAIAAGYSEKGADVAAVRLLGNARVKKLISDLVEKRASKLDLTAERVLSELSKMGFANMLDYIRTDSGGSAYIDLSALTREQAAAIQEITVDEYTEGRGDEAREVKRTRFKLGDKRGSLELLGKYLKLWIDRTESSGPNGGPIPIEVKADSLAELAMEIMQERNKA